MAELASAGLRSKAAEVNSQTLEVNNSSSYNLCRPSGSINYLLIKEVRAYGTKRIIDNVH
jgi:hypothetical protein